MNEWTVTQTAVGKNNRRTCSRLSSLPKQEQTLHIKISPNLDLARFLYNI